MSWPFLTGTALAAALHPIAGRLRVVDGRFQNDKGWWPWRGAADFTGVHYVQTGQESVIAERFDVYASVGRTIVRTFGNLNWPWFGIAIDWRAPGYWRSLDRTREMLNARGLVMHLTCYGAAEFFSNDNEYRDATRRYAEFTRDHPGVFLHLANEPYKNGWTNADDPRLLELAEIAADVLGHRDFAIGDAGDGNVPVLQKTLEHCNVALVHPSRLEDPHGRYRRWVDHLKSSAEMRDKLRAGTAFVFDEPMGAGVRVLGKRDDDPDALLSAMVVSEFLGCGFTYHWIAEEQAFPAYQLPGMGDFATFAPKIPISPDWQFSNSTPVESIRWTGLPGKTRNLLRSDEAWSIAYGEADWDSRIYEPGFAPSDLHAGPHVRVTTLNL